MGGSVKLEDLITKLADGRFEFRSWLGLGWGVAGPTLAGIRMQARQCGVELEPFGFGKMMQTVTPYDIVARGSESAVREFASYMDREGYINGWDEKLGKRPR